MGDRLPPAAAATPAQIAKGALRRLAQARLEPTPAEYARAYAEEAGEPPPTAVAPAAEPAADRAAQGAELAQLIERMVRGLERSSKGWTAARKKDSLQRVLAGSRSDAARLQQRLTQLVASWDADPAAADAAAAEPAGEAAAATAPPAPPAAPAAAPATAPVPVPPPNAAEPSAWPQLVAGLQGALHTALPQREPRAAELADQLAQLARRIAAEGAHPPLVAEVQALCQRAGRLFAHRHHLVDELSALCRSLTEGLAELSEDQSWAQGQAIALRARLAGEPSPDDAEAPDGADGALTARSVRAAADLLEATRVRQRSLRGEREQAREALKSMIARMLGELGELGTTTGRFSENVGRYADAIERADSLESLAGAVREMVGESRAVHGLVSGARERLATEHARAGELQARVLELESELRRLSDEVSTDALTQVANRRGMQQAFEAERARFERSAEAGDGSAQPAPLSIGLIDIDNFKKLNDSLGHAAGDVALQSLAARVKEWLRPVDHIARYGGEEFVVLLPATPVDEAQQVLTRLQRQLTASLFMHNGKEVFVTFSAGVTAYRAGEAIEAALERADEGLYEAKRTGKNRTCIT
jgi:diguanylate cyclase